MTPEAADYLGKARQCLDDARQIAAATPLHHIVAREAYLAAYHAAEAYLFERTGRAAKTHRGLRSEFSRLARSEPSIGREFLTFLAEGYEYKSIADYSIGSASPPITAEDGRSAIVTAARLIALIARLLA
jgi:uncharacterized protein (UPF0332 family)